MSYGDITKSNDNPPGDVQSRGNVSAVPKPGKRYANGSDRDLDTDDAQENLRNLMRWRRQARVAQEENREQMAIDEDFYDGIQLQTEDIHALDDRGQDPLVFNLVKNTCNWILGTERKSRIDFSVKPRRSQDALEAKTKTKGLKYIQDMNHGEYVRSEAFADSVRAGLGWVEMGAKNEGDEPIYYSKEYWRYMWYDHLGGMDVNNWRFILREKWLDLDITQAMLPDSEEDLKLLSSGVNSMFPYLPEDPIISDNASEFDLETDVDSLLGGAYEGLRERVKLCEMWYRIPARQKWLTMNAEQIKGSPYGTRNNIIYRADDKEHQYLVKNGHATLEDRTRMTMRVAIWCGSTYLYDSLTPYDHNDFPFFPIFCYRRQRDGAPYGIIRDIRDPQSDLNKRRSKSLHMMTAHRVIYEKGALDDPAKFRDEMDRPDGIAEVNAGALSSNKIHVVNEQALATAHIQLARDDAQFIQDIAGVTDENLGRKSNATSGKAIEARQLQGQTTSGIVFDNYYHSFQLQGEVLLKLMEQYWDGDKEIRITGDERKDEFVQINKHNEQGELENSMTRYPADFVVSKQDFRDTIRMQMLDTFNNLIQGLAKSGMGKEAFDLLDLAVNMMDELPDKEEAVARIRKMNGQEGPDEGMSPEEKQKKQQEQQQKQATQQKQQAIQEKTLQLEMDDKQAKIDGIKAKSLKDTMDAMGKRLDTFMKALETAGGISLAPQLVQAADTLIQEADKALVDGQQPHQQAQQQPVQQPIQQQAAIPPQGGIQ